MGTRAEEFQRRPDDLPPGARIGRYRIEAVAGRGGMGTVYRAFDPDTDREVAVKVLAEGSSETMRERFLHECEAEARIRHPHVMPVYDRGRFDDGRLYLVMELVYEPITLTDVVEHVQKGTLSQAWPRLRHWGAAARIIEEVIIPICEGVDAANREYRTLHRDLKPDNVLVDVRTRRPYLIDFGIFHPLDRPAEEGKVLGTPRFLSPEQARGEVHPRTDVWGLGALLHYVLSGDAPIARASPFRRAERAERVQALEKAEAEARRRGRAERAAELAARRTALLAPDLRFVEDMLLDARKGRYLPLPNRVPASLRAIVVKAMHANPEARYENAAALALDLRAWTSGGAVRAHAEADPTAAAIDHAARFARRHRATALLVLAGLLLGLPLGMRHATGGRGSPFDATPDLVVLSTDIDRLGAESPGPVEGALRWRGLVERLDTLLRRVSRWPEGRDRSAAESALAALRARLPVPRLVLDAPAAAKEQITIRSALPADRSVRRAELGENPLPPGPWRVRLSAGQREGIPVVLPLVVRPVNAPDAPPHETRLRIDLPDRGMPEGMVYVPGSRPAPGEATVRPFLIGVTEVTNLEYGAWLDELDEADRRRRLPPTGFVADAGSPGRHLVAPATEAEPVRGVSPADALAYAAWRARVWEIPVRLPTDAEWRLAAGAGLLDPWHAIFFRPPEAGGAGLQPDVGPYGARGQLTHPREIVTSGTGFRLKGAIPGPTQALAASPTPETLAAGEPLEREERLPDAGIRLVRELR